MYNPFTNISDEKSIDIVVNSILVHADQQIEPVEEESRDKSGELTGNPME